MPLFGKIFDTKYDSIIREKRKRLLSASVVICSVFSGSTTLVDPHYSSK